MRDRQGRQRFRRRQWVVNPTLQYRFVAVIVLLLLVLTAGTLLSVYIAIWTTLRTFGLMEDPVAVAQLTTAGVVTTLELLCIAPVVIWVGIRLTHRVAGPLVRITSALEQLTQGNYAVHLKLRKGDSLHEVAELINHLAEALSQRS